MEKINIAITGYYGTGSSALIALMNENKLTYHVNFNQREYEHVIFYINGGLFALGNTIASSSSPLECEVAISNFKKSMYQLYNNDYGWFGSFKKYLGNDFLSIVDDFVDSISNSSNGRNINFYRGRRTSILKIIAQILAKIIYKREIYSLGRQYIFEKRPFYNICVNKDEFYYYAIQFTNAFFELCSKNTNKKICIYDHLLLPQNYKLLDKYFENNTKLIIVQRDPRDLYILNKYFWSKKYIQSDTPLPIDIKEFIKYWKLSFIQPKKINNKNVLIIQFEDLIYFKNKVKKQLCDFFEIDLDSFVNEYSFFDESKSIKNTQTYLCKKEWKEEVFLIEEELKDFLYDFPYVIETDISQFFD